MVDRPPPISVFAPAKINLFLHVLDQRADGLHNIQSLIVFCDVGDVVTVRAADDLTLTVAGPYAEAIGPNNIVMRAAQTLRDARAGGHDARAQLSGAAIHLTKALPVAAGIGGGSSDAAATIKALCALWGFNIATGLVARIAAGLGADVPACMATRPVLVGGVGDQITAGPVLPPLSIVLINPGAPVSTADTYDGWVRKAPRVVKQGLPSFFESGDLIAWLKGQCNDLTAPAIDLAPEIEQVLSFLQQRPNCLLARMSGSGATCFGLFDDQSSASDTATEAMRAYPRWWARSTHLITDDPVAL